jgi:hypothetical protein
VVLGLMALMALIGLSYALWTKDFRNRNSQRPLIVKGKEQLPDAGTWKPVGPAELRSVGYLPRDTNVIGAVHVAEILQDPVGRTFLQQPRPAPIHWALARVEEWTGLKPEAVDHLVFGTKIGTDLPQVCLVAQTRRPYSQAELAKAKVLHGSKPTTYRNKALYHIQIRPLGDLLLWCADDRTLVALYRFEATRAEDLNAIPDAPRHGAEGLPAPLRSCLERRLGKGTQIWLAGHLDQPDILEALLTFSQVPSDVQQLFSSIQTFDVGLRFEQGVTLVADFHCTNGRSARGLTAFLRHQAAGIGSFKVVSSPSWPVDLSVWQAGAAAASSPPGGGPLAAAVLAASASGQPEQDNAADWVTLQYRADAEAIQDTLDNVSAVLPRVLRP